MLSGYTDSYLLPLARICRRADLPCYGTIEQFEILTDKKRYKELFRHYAVPTQPENIIDQLDENFANYPVLLKPFKASGVKGYVQLDNFADYQQLINSNAGQDPVDYLIDPYIEKRQEMTSFFLFLDGEIYLSGTANRFLSKSLGY